MICKDCGRDRSHNGRGLCTTCYSRWWVRQNPERKREWRRLQAQRLRQTHPDRYHARDRARWPARRDTMNVRRRERYRTHRGEERLNQANYRESHRDQIRLQQKDYYRRNRDQRLAKDRAYFQTHRDKAKELARLAAWAASEPPERRRERQRAATQRRLARKRAVPATLTREQWQAIKVAYRNCCAYCGKHSQRLTQDHVTPVTKGGGYTPDNIVPACRSCNSSKGNRPPPSIPAIRLLI